jgi:hypothetical protein
MSSYIGNVDEYADCNRLNLKLFRKNYTICIRVECEAVEEFLSGSSCPRFWNSLSLWSLEAAVDNAARRLYGCTHDYTKSYITLSFRLRDILETTISIRKRKARHLYLSMALVDEIVDLIILNIDTMLNLSRK